MAQAQVHYVEKELPLFPSLLNLFMCVYLFFKIQCALVGLGDLIERKVSPVSGPSYFMQDVGKKVSRLRVEGNVFSPGLQI